MRGDSQSKGALARGASSPVTWRYIHERFVGHHGDMPPPGDHLRADPDPTYSEPAPIEVADDGRVRPAHVCIGRTRVAVDDAPGSLKRITRGLAQLDVDVLDVKVHPLEGGLLSEMVVATDPGLHLNLLAGSLHEAGGRDIEADATSPLALVDAETRALDLAGRVAANPAELAQAVATLLDAVPVTDRSRLTALVCPAVGADMTTLRIPSPWTAPLLFDRPGRPFTPAESAGAHRLAMIAEMTYAAA